MWVKRKEPKILHRPKFTKNEKCMIAGDISYFGKTELKVWKITNLDYKNDVRVTSAIYKEFLEDINFEITNYSPLPQLPVTIQMDSAKPHLKHAKTYLLEDENCVLTPLYQPTASPDLQPIELVWGILKKRVYSRNYVNFEQLIEIIQDEWRNLSIRDIRRCIDHTQKRAKSVLEANGGWPWKK